MNKKQSTTVRRSIAALFFIILLALPAPGRAQDTPSASPEHHPLWKVEGPSNTVYLLGSIHLLKKSDYPLPTVIQTAFSNAQVAVFETDIGQMNGSGAAMLAQFTLPAGETIQDELSAKTFLELSNYLSEAGMPIAVVSPYKPAFASFFLDAIESQKLALDPAYGLDEYLYKSAQENGKTIIGLEPLDFQIKLLGGFSREEGELILQSTLDEVKDTEKDFDEMLAAWKTGDSAKLDKLLTAAFQDAPAMYKRMVTDRTENWLPKIQELIVAKKPAIVIVGAGHLVGKDGLVELLQKKGFKVSQL